MQLSDLVEALRRIKSEEAVCSTQAKVKYEQDSAAAYADLNNCILGYSNVPTTTEPPTTAAIPTASDSNTESSDVMPEEDLYEFQRKLKQLILARQLKMD